MTRLEYFDIREKISIHNQIQTFMKYIQDILEIYPQFRECTLDYVDDYLKNKETAYELEIQKDLKVDIN